MHLCSTFFFWSFLNTLQTALYIHRSQSILEISVSIVFFLLLRVSNGCVSRGATDPGANAFKLAKLEFSYENFLQKVSSDSEGKHEVFISIFQCAGIGRITQG